MLIWMRLQQISHILRIKTRQLLLLLFSLLFNNLLRYILPYQFQRSLKRTLICHMLNFSGYISISTQKLLSFHMKITCQFLLLEHWYFKNRMYLNVLSQMRIEPEISLVIIEVSVLIYEKAFEEQVRADSNQWRLRVLEFIQGWVYKNKANLQREMFSESCIDRPYGTLVLDWLNFWEIWRGKSLTWSFVWLVRGLIILLEDLRWVWAFGVCLDGFSIVAFFI